MEKPLTAFEVGTAVRHRRKALHLNQRDTALASGTGIRFISDLENGKPTCELGKTLAVLASLGLRCTLTPRELP